MTEPESPPTRALDLAQGAQAESDLSETSREASRSLSTDLPEPALRALAEAEARRTELDAWDAAREAEEGGRGGKDPVRYGDWEVKGLACDF